MKTIEFDFDLQDDRTVKVVGDFDDQDVYFKIYDSETNKKLSKNLLTQMETQNIEDFIRENADEIYELNDLDYYNENYNE